MRTREVAYFSKKGKQIWSEPRGQFAGYSWPQFSVHRGGFQMMLFHALEARAGKGTVVTGREAVDCKDVDGGVIVTFPRQAGQSLDRRRHGLRRLRRHSLQHPREILSGRGRAALGRLDPVARNGQGQAFITEATMGMAGHEWQKFVTYPISKTDPETGEAEINWIAELKFPPDKKWNREDYNRHGNFDDFFPAFQDWHFDWLDIPKLMQDGGYCYEFPMVDRDPVERWTFGRTTLAGDAAHAMYPIGSKRCVAGHSRCPRSGARVHRAWRSASRRGGLTRASAGRRPRASSWPIAATGRTM